MCALPILAFPLLSLLVFSSLDCFDVPPLLFFVPPVLEEDEEDDDDDSNNDDGDNDNDGKGADKKEEDSKAAAFLRLGIPTTLVTNALGSSSAH